MQLSTTPHNNFFAQLMSRKPIAQAMFGRHLPDDLHQEADLSLLEPVESKHISDDGVTLYNDVLYRCPLRGGQLAYFFAIAEHQRNPDKDMRIRLAKYNVGIYEDCSRQQYDHMPIIAHFVLYNGKEPWPYSTAFDDYYANPVLGTKYFHMAPFTLINMPTYLPAQIQEDKELGFCFGAFYSSTQPDPYKTFADLMNVPSFEEHIKKLPIEDKNIVSSYLGHLINRKTYTLENLVHLVSANDKEEKNIMTSIAQAYQQQGMQQGMQTVARTMLSDKTPLEQVSKWTGLSKEELAKLTK